LKSANICIGAIAEFTDVAKSAIWASGYDKSFLSKENLPTSSLCRFVGMTTPGYEVTHWTRDSEPVVHDGVRAELEVYHTPGHTPDELAVFDRKERFLFVGDTLYEWANIIFPVEGDLVAYSNSIGKLRELVDQLNHEVVGAGGSPFPRVNIACGHVTSAADGADILADVDRFLCDVVRGSIEGTEGDIVRDERLITYERDDGRFSFRGPLRLFEEFKKDEDAMEKIVKRNAPILAG
jgi:glyoxylase-like metal-dependent hydrolase (beta-lactamase superfamily II)